jgi:hypothetical protein
MPGEKVEDNLNYADKKTKRQTSGSIETLLNNIEKGGKPEDFEKLESLVPGSTMSLKKGNQSFYGLNQSVINEFLKGLKDL